MVETLLLVALIRLLRDRCPFCFLREDYDIYTSSWPNRGSLHNWCGRLRVCQAECVPSALTLHVRDAAKLTTLRRFLVSYVAQDTSHVLARQKPVGAGPVHHHADQPKAPVRGARCTIVWKP